MRVTLGVLAATLAAGVVAEGAQGQSVPFVGCTSAAFDAAAPATPCGTFQSTTLGGYTWENSTFSGVTAGGVATLNGPMNGPGGIEVDNFGAFYGTGAAFDYTGHTFNIRFQFSVPGAGDVSVTGNLNGVFDIAAGTPILTFPSGFASFPYNNGVTFGTVTVGVHNIALGSLAAAPYPGVVSITAFPVAVPEPRTVALLATGLIGLVGAGAGRRRAAT
jgi:hypothetical protein